MADLVSSAPHVQKVTQEHEKSLSMCLQKIDQWKKYKTDYEVVQERLKTLSDKLSYNIMVPFGTHAFIPGTLVHTNEVTVLLGDNWFVKVSTKQACEIIGRRIKHCDKMLVDLNKEKSQFENWISFMSDMTNQDLVEIREEFDPKKEAVWREQHVKHLKEYKQKGPSTEDGSGESAISIESEDYYFKRLEQLEVEERKSERNHEEEDELTSSEDTDEEQASVSVESKPKENGHIDDNNDHNSSTGETEKSTETTPVKSVILHDSEKDQSRHVRWIDLSEEKSRRITFTHSTLKTSPPKRKHRRRRRSSSTSEVEEEENLDSNNSVINSPSDIYKCFSFTNQCSKPKSILKTINSTNTVPLSSSLESTSSEDMNLSEPNGFQEKNEKEVTEKAFTGTIFERSIGENLNSTYSKDVRPKSLFKHTRKAKH